MPSEDRKIPRELQQPSLRQCHSSDSIFLHTTQLFCCHLRDYYQSFSTQPFIYFWLTTPLPLLTSLFNPRLCASTSRFISSKIAFPQQATLFDENVEGLTKQSFYPLATPSNLAPDRKIPFEPVKLAATNISSTPFIRPLLGTVLPVFCGTTTRPP